jgi:hypothetical protein
MDRVTDGRTVIAEVYEVIPPPDAAFDFQCDLRRENATHTPDNRPPTASSPDRMPSSRS